MRESELIPCPYCGCKNISIYENEFDIGDDCKDMYLCLCHGCGAWTGYKHTEDDAVKAWNRRI